MPAYAGGAGPVPRRIMIASPVALDGADGAVDLLFCERPRKFSVLHRSQRLCGHVRMYSANAPVSRRIDQSRFVETESYSFLRSGA